MLVYKELQLLGDRTSAQARTPYVCGAGGTWVGGERMVIGSSLLIQACAERTASPWPDASGSWCIPRVIHYSK